MVTIFDYNPTELEMKRFGSFPPHIKELYMNCGRDSHLYHLGLLFAMRGDMEKSDKYFSQIENKELLRTLVEDF